MTLAIVCPGQGSQVVGMGRALADAHPAAARVFAAVDEALGEKLSSLIWDGPMEMLTLTANAQPALMAASVAAMRALESEAGLNAGRDVAFFAGHSLGEYSALACAGSISVADAAKLLRLRGASMQKAMPVGEGAMAVLLGLEWDQAAAVAAEAAQGQVCEPANDNGPGQIVISGHRPAVERAVVIAKARGAKRAMLLPVSAPFHCSLMQPAADAMQAALATVQINPPAAPVVANVAAGPVTDVEAIRANLVKQVTGAVRWRESVGWMAANGVDHFLEVGAGKVLTGLARRIAPAAQAGAAGTPDDVTAFAAAFHA